MNLLNDSMKEELQKMCGTVLFDEPLSRYTTIRIGGPADCLVYPKTIEELSQLISWSRRNKISVFVLGAGSNLLVRDKGIRGLVISLSQGFGNMELEQTDHEHPTLYAEAGVGLPRLVDFSTEEGLSGLEGLAGIPGNVGGGLTMNAGTPQGEIADAVLTVTFLDKEGKLVTWEKEKIKFAYRQSHFPRGAILVSARFKTKRMASELIRGSVQKSRSGRIETQPLNVPNLGSVFKNPEKGTKNATPRGATPLFAGRLIEETGLKDIRVGGARVSPKHGNFIVNEGGAKAKDVIALIGLIQDKVKEKFGIRLETEVRIVGEE